MKRFKIALHLVAALWLSPALAGSYEDFFNAVAGNDAATVRSLLQRGFDTNSRDPKGQTGLFLALQGGALDVAEALLQDPVLDVNAANEVGETALMMAALKGQQEWARRLLERGAQVNRRGWSPLHYAATGPEPAVVTLLLDRGAAIEAESPNRTTPLMMAARYGNPASVDILLQRGADPRRRNDLRLDAAEFARLAGREALASRLQQRAR